ncbi:MAG TPA: tRNA (guanosine(37)-N1)-methyltransferase TrmD [Candidatus Moranbacteria bacterium]|nr:tRNA (guanosine(37)-N1)-methyltransferase TrmD [Candidatus Moranbacteria bacterium]HSA08013.1 tRNA (guanosine(37)-N1)-methyltransferase TrmD [Candidatus Moranbacteria bacterium]
MKFDIVTIFPDIFTSYFNESIIKRAQKNGAVEINVHNLRDYTTDKHKTVDDTPYGGGAGMVLKIEPIYRCVASIKSEIRKSKSETNPKSKIKNLKQGEKLRTILFSAKGKKYTQKDAKRLSKYDQLIFICGRYEGVDERVAEKIADEEISIGDFVLTGGEIPAMVVVDSITRLLPGVLGNDQSAIYESHSEDGYLEHAQYTKPEEFFAKGESVSGGNVWKVPKILLSGHHAEIEKWRKKKSKNK